MPKLCMYGCICVYVCVCVCVCALLGNCYGIVSVLPQKFSTTTTAVEVAISCFFCHPSFFCGLFFCFLSINIWVVNHLDINRSYPTSMEVKNRKKSEWMNECVCVCESVSEWVKHLPGKMVRFVCFHLTKNENRKLNKLEQRLHSFHTAAVEHFVCVLV